jgi:(p)ppGpp synthase/HD superfamily hydrolase
MLRMETEEQMMTAVLHDVVEDSHWTLIDLQREGFPEQVIEAVDHLSRRDSETYDEFIDRIKGSMLAIKVKLADLEDNMDLKRVNKITDKEKERMMKYHAAWCDLKGVQPNPNKREIL